MYVEWASGKGRGTCHPLKDPLFFALLPRIWIKREEERCRAGRAADEIELVPVKSFH